MKRKHRLKKKLQTCSETSSNMRTCILQLIALLTRASPKLMPPIVTRMSRQSVQELHIIPCKRIPSSAAILTRPCVQESMMKNCTFFSGSLMKTSWAIAFDLRATHLLPQLVFPFIAFRARMEWLSGGVLQSCARKSIPRKFFALVTVHVANQLWNCWVIYSARADLINFLE